MVVERTGWGSSQFIESARAYVLPAIDVRKNLKKTTSAENGTEMKKKQLSK